MDEVEAATKFYFTQKYLISQSLFAQSVQEITQGEKTYYDFFGRVVFFLIGTYMYVEGIL